MRVPGLARLKKAVVKAVQSFHSKLDDPIIGDRSDDLMCGAVWASLSIWGVVSVVLGLPTLTQATSLWYEALWGTVIALTGFIAAIAALSTFFFTPDITLRIRRKRVEFASLMILTGFALVYPIFLFLLSIQGDADRAAAFFASLVYIFVPAWRLRRLWKRTQKLQELRADEIVRQRKSDELG